MAGWKYGVARFDGKTIDEYETLGEIGTPTDTLTLLNNAGVKGWEFCGTVPTWALGDFEEHDTPRPLLLVFKHPRR